MVKKRVPNRAEVLLGQNIKRLRLFNNMTCMQLGRKINKIEQQIKKYEKGEFVPLSVLEAIGLALGEPIQKRLIRRISSLRKLEIETKIEQVELSDLYDEVLRINI